MKKYYALLPSYYYYNLDEYSKRTFNISLLTYDGIYTMTSKLNLLNQKKVLKENFRLEDFFSSENSSIDANTYMFMRFFLDNDIKTAKILFKEKVIKDIYSSSFRKKLSRENFIKDSFWLQYGNQMISVFPSSELFIYIYKELLKNYDHDIIYKNIKDINIVLRDIIISEHFKRCYNIDSIYTSFHLEIISMLKEMPNYLFKESSNINVINIDKYRMFCLSNGISKYYHNTNELFSINQNKKQDRIISLFSETLPDMSEIPVKVIFEAKKKDKFRSLPYLAEEISLKKDISSEDLVKYFDEKVWEFAANSLKISATEVLMNVMGYYPDTGISATIQLFSQFKGLVSKYEMYRNNGWIIPIQELKKYSKK